MKCVVGTVCKVHRGVEARGSQRMYVVQEVEKICDTGWIYSIRRYEG